MSSHLRATVRRDGKIHQQEYKIGEPKYALKVIGKTDKRDSGTEIQFTPDKEIFSTVEFDFAVLRKRLQEIAFLNPVKIVLEDKRTDKKETFNYKGGLVDFVEHINKSKTVLHKPIYFKRQEDGTVVD